MLDSSTTPTQTTAPQTIGDNSQYDRERQQQGTGFTNINRILGANQGAGAQLGQSIGNTLNNQANSVKSGIQQGQSQFQAGMQQGSNQANQYIQAGQTNEKQAGESDSDYATRLANSTQDFAQTGTNLGNAAYAGPTGLSNADQLQAQAASASALGRLTQNAAGQQQLLASTVAKPGNYTSGDSALDQLLLGQGGQSYLQQGRAATTGLTNQATNAVSDATNQATAQSGAIQNNKVNTQQALVNYLSGTGDSTSNGITGITTQAANQATTFNTNAGDVQKMLGDIASGKFNPNNYTPAQLAELGDVGQYGINQADFYIKDEDGKNTGDLATVAQNSAQSLGFDPSLYTTNNTSTGLGDIGSIAGSLNTAINSGNAYYQGDQNKAAQNLALLTGNGSEAQTLKALPAFNTNVFSNANPYAALMGQQEGLDKGIQGIETSRGQDAATIQTILNNAQNATGTLNDNLTTNAAATTGGGAQQFTNPLFGIINTPQYAALQQYAGTDQLLNGSGGWQGGSASAWNTPDYFKTLAQNSTGTSETLQDYINSVINKPKQIVSAVK